MQSYLLRNSLQQDVARVVKELHDGPAGGHFSGYTIAYKIIRAGYYWPNLFKDAHTYVRKCDMFQRSGGRKEKAVGPLQ